MADLQKSSPPNSRAVNLNVLKIKGREACMDEQGTPDKK